MRLVIAEGPQDLWVHLEPETWEEMMALETCAARGEWTNGRAVKLRCASNPRRWRLTAT